MSPIDGVARALELLRRRLGNGAAGSPAASASAASVSSASRQADAAGGIGGPGVPRDLREAVASQLMGLDADDANYLDRATEVFVERVLLSEFGGDLTNDPRFRQVIRAVSREMAASPEASEELRALFRDLRNG